MKNFANCNLIVLVCLLVYTIKNNAFNKYLPKLIMLSLRCLPYFLTKDIFIVMLYWKLSYLTIPIICSPSRMFYIILYVIYLCLNYLMITYLANNDEMIIAVLKFMHGLLCNMMEYVILYTKKVPQLNFIGNNVELYFNYIKKITIDVKLIQYIPSFTYPVFIIFLLLLVNYYTKIGLHFQLSSLKINFFGIYLLMIALTGVLQSLIQRNEALFAFHENNVQLLDLFIWNPAYIYFYTKYLEMDHK